LNQEELDTIFLNKSTDEVSPHQCIQLISIKSDSLESYIRKPECFRRVAGYMHVQCSELELDEDQRVRSTLTFPSDIVISLTITFTVAISMTLCELATAKHHSPPMECHSFTREFSDTSQGTRDCVE
jgi:hypothetical protein